MKNFQTTLLKRDSNISCEYYGLFKIFCFEEYLRIAASIRYYFDTINLKQSGFRTTSLLNSVVGVSSVGVWVRGWRESNLGVGP